MNLVRNGLRGTRFIIGVLPSEFESPSLYSSYSEMICQILSVHRFSSFNTMVKEFSLICGILETFV